MKLLAFLSVVALSHVVRADDVPSFKLLPPDSEPEAVFGIDVAVSGDTLVVGAQFAGNNVGRAFVYRWDGSAWGLEATLAPADGLANDYFGLHVEIDGDAVVVGAPSAGASNTGAAYVFRRTGNTWVQEAKLVASDADAGDSMGSGVAIDGETIVAGAGADNVGANADQGSAYVFTRINGTWAQRAKLVASDGLADDLFGYSSVAVDGRTVIVGAIGDDIGANNSQGSAYVYVSTSGLSWTSWVEQQKLVATAAAAFDGFGEEVDIEGNTVVVGANGRDGPVGVAQGAVFVFARSGSVWTQQQELLAPDAGASDSATWLKGLSLSGDTIAMGRYQNLSLRGAVSVFRNSGSTWIHHATLRAPDATIHDFFGYAVDVSNGTLVSGAYKDNDGSRGAQPRGSVYIHHLIGNEWVEGYQRITPPTAGLNEQFGTSVAVGGGTALVGAPLKDAGPVDQGAVGVYDRTGNLWDFRLLLTPSNGAAGDNFGRSVAIDGDTAVVGAYLDDVGANTDQGSVYVFTRSGTVWTQQTQLFASDGAANDRFGTSVAISNGTILVGSWFDDVGANADQGSVYVFTGSGATWTQQTRLTASDGAATDYFGYSLAFEGNTVLIGAYGDDATNSDQGSVYCFTRTGATWTQQQRLNASNGLTGDRFGYSLALDGDNAIIGAYWDDVGPSAEQGSAYVFTRPTFGGTWAQQAQLVAPDGAANDRFGSSVALEGNIAFVGAPNAAVGAEPGQGAGYFFVRSGTQWYFKDKSSPLTAITNDGLGNAAAIDGGTVIVGASLTDVSAATNTGAAYFFDYGDWAYALVRNETSGQTYASLAAAVTGSLNGNTLTTSGGTFWLGENVDTLSRQVFIGSQSGIARPFHTVTTLGQGSTLSAAPGHGIALHGLLQTTIGGTCELYANEVFQSASGELNCRGPSARISIYSPQVDLHGRTRLEGSAVLSLSGGAVFSGPLTMLSGSYLFVDGPVSFEAQTSIYSGTVSAPTITVDIQSQLSALSITMLGDFYNSGRSFFIGGGAVLGNLTNNAGGLIDVQNGTIVVAGTVTNNGTINGTVCCGPDGALTFRNGYHGGPTSGLAVTGGHVAIAGNADLAMTTNALWHMMASGLKLTPGQSPSTLEAPSRDFGPTPAGLDPGRSGAMPVGTLTIAEGAFVTLVDTRDNDESAEVSEAFYCTALIVRPGAILNTDGPSRIYCSTVSNDGLITDPSKVVLINPCAADFNHDGFVTGHDFDAYVNAFETGDPASDFDQDGFVNGADFDQFVYAYEEGC